MCGSVVNHPYDPTCGLNGGPLGGSLHGELPLGEFPSGQWPMAFFTNYTLSS
jgi:hypothetical protein